MKCAVVMQSSLENIVQNFVVKHKASYEKL